MRHYRAPTAADLQRERQVLELLQQRFAEWQATGCIPSRRIEPGYNTDQPIRERGWTHWHHLFNPRQLLLNGIFAEFAARETDLEAKALLLMQGRLANWNSRLSGWDSSRDQGKQTFYNQALNTLENYVCRTVLTLQTSWESFLRASRCSGSCSVSLVDARETKSDQDIWITDPGYADAINYDEVSEFFLAWYDKRLTLLFPGWYSDSRRALMVSGTGEQFRVTLAGCYRHLEQQTPDDGIQIVMFTHQDPAIWSDLALVLWSAGLQVVSAWTVQTETPSSGVKGGFGNYTQGTVCLVLRKRQNNRTADKADLYPDIQAEVQSQLTSMLAIDDKDDPNFGDADYQLAAYAAALRVLTSYSRVEEIDVERELRRERGKKERSPLATLIEQAVKIASDVLVPDGFDAATWRKLGPEERFYLKGIEVEASGDAREGVYQELARGYGAADYADMLASRAANATRLKTPSEFAGRELHATSGFGSTLLRQVIYAIYVTATDPTRDPKLARDYLKRELADYWSARATIIAMLRYLSTRPHGISHWAADLRAAHLLLGSIQGDSV
jgi:adenine-specific DNA methylase